MSKRTILALPALLALAMLVGCETTQTARAPAALPADVEIATPGDEVPADVAAFLGVWEGQWGSGLDGKLAVKSVTADGDATAIYAWGDSPGNFEAGRAEVKGEIRNGRLVLAEFPSGARAAYELQTDGTLEGTYTREDGAVFDGLFFKRDAG